MAPAQQLNTGHEDAVHDVAVDYFGRRLATASSDGLVKVFDLAGDTHTHLADLRGHTGPVWQVSWAHPKFGSLLASCSFDARVIVWKEGPDGGWGAVWASPEGLHGASVNAVQWAPHELGALQLACAGSDGALVVLTHDAATGGFAAAKLERAHLLGCTAVSWAPAAPPGSLVSPGAAGGPLVRKLATGGCDSLVKIWAQDERSGGWAPDGPPLRGHRDWVRDVAWAPNLGLPSNSVASCGQDGLVLVWTQAEPGGGWAARELADFRPSPVWRVAWSVFGGVLAVCEQARVTLWKEAPDGVWAQVAQE